MTAIVIPRGEIGYATLVANATATTLTAVGGLSVTVAVGTRPIIVSFCGKLSNSVAASYTTLFLYEDGVAVQDLSKFFATAGINAPVAGFVRRMPAAGAHTYTVQLGSTDQAGGAGTGTGTLVASTAAPANLEVVEV